MGSLKLINMLMIMKQKTGVKCDMRTKCVSNLVMFKAYVILNYSPTGETVLYKT